MENNEIYIDGVDVAGCNDFYKEWDNWSGKDNYCCQDCLSGMCAGNNCYYKQLKRLEQENKELKARIKHQCYKCRIGDNTEDKLHSALEEIREIITNDNSMIIDKKIYFELQCGEPVALKLQKIYNKINEVLQ